MGLAAQEAQKEQAFLHMDKPMQYLWENLETIYAATSQA
jgi:hypothetical protein